MPDVADSMNRTVVLVLALLLFAPASAAAWDPAQDVSPDGFLDFAVAPDGGAALGSALWVPGGRGSVYVRTAAPGAAFGAPARLRPPTRFDLPWSVGVTPAGGGVAAFERRHKPYARVRVTDIGEAGLGTLRTISSRGHTARRPAVAVAPDGQAVAAWVQYDGRRWGVEAAVRMAGAPRFGAPQVLARSVGRNALVDVEMGPRGDAVVTWRGNEVGDGAFAAVRHAGSPELGPADRLTGASYQVRVTIGAAGQAVAVFASPGGSRPRPGNPDPEDLTKLSVATLAPGADAFGPPQDVAGGGDTGPSATAFAVALGPDDRVLVAWNQHGTLGTWEGAFGGPLTQTATLGTGLRGEIQQPAVALDAGGRALVTWTAPVPNRPGDPTARSRQYAALRPAGGTFGAAAPLGPEFQSPEAFAAALLPSGRALVVWRAFDTEALAGQDGRALYASRG
jgi:hypothetical protein